MRRLTDRIHLAKTVLTPNQLAKQPARTINQFTVILNEIDQQTEEERQKTEKEAKKHER